MPERALRQEPALAGRLAGPGIVPAKSSVQAEAQGLGFSRSPAPVTPLHVGVHVGAAAFTPHDASAAGRGYDGHVLGVRQRLHNRSQGQLEPLSQGLPKMNTISHSGKICYHHKDTLTGSAPPPVTSHGSLVKQRVVLQATAVGAMTKFGCLEARRQRCHCQIVRHVPMRVGLAAVAERLEM